jgi:hypothetical protein
MKVAKTAQEKLAAAEERLAKAQHKARVALAEAVEARKLAGVGPRQAAPPVPGPAASAYDDHLVAKSLAGDPEALALLRKRGGHSAYIGQMEHTLATTTNPAMKVWAAGAIAVLDESFDPYGPMPRGAGSSW